LPTPPFLEWPASRQDDGPAIYWQTKQQSVALQNTTL